MTIAATNTAEGVQTVRAASTYTPTAGLGPVVLPETTWTPTGAGPIRFTLAAPGNASAAGATLPYGSVFLSLGTEGAPATLDCAPAAITIANAAIPWSDAGRNGSAGRYAIDANPARPVFAERGQQPAAAGGDADAHGDGDGEPAADGEPGSAAATPVPTATPTPTPVVKAPAGRIGSTRLTAHARRPDRAPAGLPAGLIDLPRHDRRDQRLEDQARQARQDRHADALGALHDRARQAAHRDAAAEQGRARRAQAQARDPPRGSRSRPARASPPRAGSR